MDSSASGEEVLVETAAFLRTSQLRFPVSEVPLRAVNGGLGPSPRPILLPTCQAPRTDVPNGRPWRSSSTGLAAAGRSELVSGPMPGTGPFRESDLDPFRWTTVRSYNTHSQPGARTNAPLLIFQDKLALESPNLKVAKLSRGTSSNKGSWAFGARLIIVAYKFGLQVDPRPASQTLL